MINISFNFNIILISLYSNPWIKICDFVRYYEFKFQTGPFKRIECIGGWYGVDCKQQCSGHCRDNAVCNHVTGQCDKGCAVGWRGALCDKGMQRSTCVLANYFL